MALNRLSARAVTTIAKPGLHADGGGLYLQVKNGGRSWIFRYRLNDKDRAMGLGPIHTVSLAEAREEAEKRRKQVRAGRDPIQARKLEEAATAFETATAMTFKQCAEAYMTAHEAGWKSAIHAQQWRSTLTRYAYPVLGSLSVRSIDTGLVLKVVEPLWTTKTETASRVRGRIESVLDWAAARKYRDGENPARWRGHLDKLLPARSKVKKVVHHAALPYEQMATFMTDLRQRDGVAALGLEFQILTATRTGEVIGARWDEFDLSKKLWTIPGDRMKAGLDHRVPLSPAALSIVAKLKEAVTGEYVFPGAKHNKPLSNMAFLALLKRMGRSDLTAHGFRSAFRDWAAERTAFPRDVAEMALAHTIGDKVEAAYRRGDLFKKRTQLMDAWASYCAAPTVHGESVVPLKRKA